MGAKQDSPFRKTFNNNLLYTYLAAFCLRLSQLITMELLTQMNYHQTPDKRPTPTLLID